MRAARKRLLQLLAEADVGVDGARPWDLEVHNPKLYRRVLTQGSMGLGESYVDGWWDCAALDEFFARVTRARLERRVPGAKAGQDAAFALLFNMQNRMRAKRVARRHYDVGNDLYRRMLDRRMLYSCGYWRRAEDLDQAQEAKLELIACKLGLRGGERLLDIGCGWGGACRHFAERHGAEVVGITLSAEQAELARETCAGLPVEIRLQDYRDLPRGESYDAVYSIGMFEHVGCKNYGRFMRRVRALLPEGGRFLLHTIGSNVTSRTTDPWINRYIFPHGQLPSVRQIGKAIEDRFALEDWHSFGRDYDRTLMEWRGNFERAWGELRGAYDERFYRMWRYYLSCCAGAFRSRYNQLWQVLLAKGGLEGELPDCR